jgi:hypothetical protein
MLKLVDHLYHLGKEVQLSMKVETYKKQKQKTHCKNQNNQESAQVGILKQA